MLLCKADKELISSLSARGLLRSNKPYRDCLIVPIKLPSLGCLF